MSSKYFRYAVSFRIDRLHAFGVDIPMTFLLVLLLQFSYKTIRLFIFD